MATAFERRILRFFGIDPRGCHWLPPSCSSRQHQSLVENQAARIGTALVDRRSSESKILAFTVVLQTLHAMIAIYLPTSGTILFLSSQIGFITFIKSA